MDIAIDTKEQYESIANDVNDTVGKDVETADTVERWVLDNQSSLAEMLKNAIIGELCEAYD